MRDGPQPAVCLVLVMLLRALCAPAQITPDDRAFAIVDAALVPMTSKAEELLEHHTLVVRDQRIAAICDEPDDCVPDDAVVIDGKGGFVIPALADMHNHFGGWAWDGRDESRIRMRNQNLRQYVMFGVATVRDPAGNALTLQMRDSIERGELFGPRIYSAWGAMDGNPPLFPGPRPFTDPATAAEFVQQTATAGYDLVKVYTTLSPEVFDAVLEAASSVGLSVAAHVPMQVPLEHALAKGLRSIEHLTGYDVACAAPHVELKPIPQDIYQGWAWCTPEKVRELAALTAQHDVWNVPTLALWDSTVTEFDRPQRGSGEVAKWEHPTTSSGVDWLYTLYGPRERAGITGTRSVRLGLVKALHDAGAPILVGTDISAAGYTVHREIALLVEAGLTPYEALTAATSEAARYLGEEGEFGVLEVGARADVVLLGANPLEDVAHLRDIRGLMIRGEWWNEEAIQAELDSLQREYAEDAERARQLGFRVRP